MVDTPVLNADPISASRLPELAVIIVNYCTSDLTIEAVESVLSRDHGGRAIEVHVVDNASPDESAGVLKTAHSNRGWGERVTLWLEGTNHGFGRGNNIVINMLLARDIPPGAVFLLNPDARLENEAINILAKRMDTDIRLGFAGAGISTPDGEPRVAAFRFPSIVGEFSKALSFGPVSKMLRRWQVPLSPEIAEGSVDWVAGAAVLIRMETLREIGVFDPDFFLYYEEVELMRRGAEAGWGCRYVPEAQVVHIEGAATDVKSKREARKRIPSYRYASWRIYFTKTHGRTGAFAAAIANVFGTAGNYVITRLRRKEAAAAPHFFEDFWRHAMKPLIFGV